MDKLAKILILILISWGLVVKLAFIFSFDKKYPDETEFIAIVEVVSMKKEKDKSSSYTVKVVNSNIDKTKNTKIILYTSKNSDLQYGDIIKISGTFSKGDVARNYKGFNYRNYLKQSKIYGTIYSKQVTKIGHKSGVIEKIYIVKNKLYNILDSVYKNENHNSFLKGILLGDSSNLDDEIKENFQDSSMSHVLAISGMHISYVILGVQAVLSKVINSRKLKNYILIVILIFFLIITGMSPSCIRACIMSIMLFVSQNFYRKNNFYLSILYTFFILLFINPYNIFSVGMWLSFGGTLGIVLFHKFMKRFLECKLKIKSKFCKTFLDIFLVSFSAQILILPIMIYCFNTISLTFFISNMIIYFIVGPLLALGYISLGLGLISIKLGNFLGIFENFLIAIIFKVAEICSKLLFSKIYLATPDLWMVILYYIVISSIIFLFHKKKIQILRFILGNGTSLFFKKKWKKVILSAIVIILICNVVSVIPKNLEIFFVDVGQRRL